MRATSGSVRLTETDSVAHVHSDISQKIGVIRHSKLVANELKAAFENTASDMGFINCERGTIKGDKGEGKQLVYVDGEAGKTARESGLVPDKHWVCKQVCD